jgi:hypothetical protein
MTVPEITVQNEEDADALERDDVSHFRAAASFSGSPDAVGYTRHTVAIGGEVPFNFMDPMELQLRSARVYAASFKCPVRIYYGADETHFALSSKPTAQLAQAHHLNVQAIAVDGGHNSALPAEMGQAIQFFGQTSLRKLELPYLRKSC